VSVLLRSFSSAARRRQKTASEAAGAVAGVKVYGIVDKTGTGEEPYPWLVPGLASLYEPPKRGSKLRPIS
jgi:hypothetical protein